MADLNITRKVHAGANLKVGMVCYFEKRKGIVAKLARFLHKRYKRDFLHRLGYEVLPATTEEFSKVPLGIALDEKTILVQGSLNLGNPKNMPSYYVKK